MHSQTETTYLKLGGSLITDKHGVRSPRLDVIQRVAEEIQSALGARPEIGLIVGHGSGSFGHVSAYEHGTRDGVYTQADWDGFVEVWRDASALNNIIMESFHSAGIPAIRFSPSGLILSDKRSPRKILYEPIIEALSHGLVPVVYGDVIFDRSTGGTIYSTEEVFTALADHIEPQRMLIAGIEAGVFADYPACEQLIAEITPKNHPKIIHGLKSADTIDVTGGMLSKVELMFNLIERHNELKIEIFSGKPPGNIQTALMGDSLGTTIHA